MQQVSGCRIATSVHDVALIDGALAALVGVARRWFEVAVQSVSCCLQCVHQYDAVVTPAKSTCALTALLVVHLRENILSKTDSTAAD